jgi:hypothetical protein
LNDNIRSLAVNTAVERIDIEIGVVALAVVFADDIL